MVTARVIGCGNRGPERQEMGRACLDELKKNQPDVTAGWPGFVWEYDQATSCSFFGESLFTSLNIFFQHGEWRKGAFLWWVYEFLFLRVMNAKVELGRGLKVLHHDVGYGFAEVLLLAFMVPRHENLLFAVGSLWYPGLGNRCTEHLQQIASGEAGVYREGIF